MNLSPFEKWTEEHINYVLSGRPQESRVIDYKQRLPKDEKDLLADVSAFANTQGGVILYGIIEDKGVPEGVQPLQIADEDAESLRLSHMIRANLDPSLTEFHIDVINTEKGKVVALRIPPSLNAPHMIAKGTPKFYARGAAGNIPMDSHEIKSAFLMADGLNAKVASFREDRCAQIVADKLPFKLYETSVAVFHIIPLSAIQRPRNFSMTELAAALKDTRPPGNHRGFTREVCLEGAIQAAFVDNSVKAYSYVVLFRNGALEITMPCKKAARDGKPASVDESSVLVNIFDEFSEYMAVLRRLEISPPFLFGLSYLDCEGLVPLPPTNSMFNLARQPRPISISPFYLPALETNDLEPDPHGVFLHFSNLLANASGFISSKLFKDGRMIGRTN